MQKDDMNTTDNQEKSKPDSEHNNNEEPVGQAEKEQPAQESAGDDEVSALKNEISEMNDKYIRLVAEFDNFRKRNAKERVDLIKTASEDVIKDLLEVLDDSDRAMQQIEKSSNLEEIKDGIQLVFQKLKTILQSKGLVAMESKEQDFNPDLHEAITEIPAPTDDLKGKVVDEIIKGYTLNDKIIRHAKVVVGK